MSGQKAVVIGISGASSSGKTTLARLLRDIFPSTFILHEDDFYKPEDQLPVKHGLIDWDCQEALAVSDMEAALSHIRATGEFPPDLESKEDQNSVGKCPVSDAAIQAQKDKVSAWLAVGQPGQDVFETAGLRVCLLDGFLLYASDMQKLMGELDMKLFLLVSHDKATQRREARDGYVTLEGFWEDPPGYVDKIVWPNYVESHQWLFEDGNVEGKLKEDILAANGIQAQLDKGVDVEFATTLEWAVETIMKDLQEFVAKKSA